MSSSHAGARVPTLYEAVEALKSLDMYMFLELKDPGKQVQKKTTSCYFNHSLHRQSLLLCSCLETILFSMKELFWCHFFHISFIKYSTEQSLNDQWYFVFLYQIRQLDPDIIIGLVLRQTILTIDSTGACRFDSKCKYLFVSAIEKLMWRLLTSYVWKALGVNLILPHSVDIIKNR